jgi:hypothetical protein
MPVTVAFVNSDPELTTSGAFGLALTSVRPSLLQAVKLTASNSATAEVWRRFFRIV